ncbi:hypothetical protein, partial [Neisseria sp. HMSC065D04]|uniref:hypothetical protein n=1 Tax=Neisseria sp. HMSC065D04 TaxID=1739542 RepID=UPI001AEF44C7
LSEEGLFCKGLARQIEGASSLNWWGVALTSARGEAFSKVLKHLKKSVSYDLYCLRFRRLVLI